jgi:hypothetical protein
MSSLNQHVCDAYDWWEQGVIVGAQGMYRQWVAHGKFQ